MFNEAKGLIHRHKINIKFISFSWADKNLIRDFNYIKSADMFLKKLDDHFGPVSRPFNEYLKLPTNVKIEWISKRSQIHKLKALLNDNSFIGIDCEWLIEIYKGNL